MTDFRSLPVYKHREEILNALSVHQTIIVESPTGSGKTTQIPLILREAGYDAEGIIGITQPRRIAAVSVCEFIKKQIDDTASYCAYKMRFADTSDKTTRIKIMTDGILLQEVKLDRTLSKYSVIMVDEAHERSLNIDFILGLLKEITAVRKDLKIIISSATINATSFSTFFDNAPIVSIDSRPYPVTVSYVPLVLTRDTEDYYYPKIASIVRKTWNEKEGDVLIFLPGEAEIKRCIEELEYSDPEGNYQIYPLYGRLSKEEQERVFIPTKEGKMKVVVSTNIAETSITIDGVRTVIDSGMAKINFYNQKNFTSALLPMPISRASADQRKGRAGRTAPGRCFRLYSEENYTMRPEYSEEEILHSDLAEVVLRMSELEIYNTESFPFITPPKKSALSSAEETLLIIGAIERNHHLTRIGGMMILFPLLPRLSRVIVESIMNYPDVIADVLIAVAFLSAKTPYILPPGEELQARDAHHALSDKMYGDFGTMLSLFTSYRKLAGKKEREAYAKRHYLDYESMEEIVHIDQQLESIVSQMGIPIPDRHSIPEYFCCLASGLRQYVCMRIDRFSYRSLTADKILIHPGSAWFSIPPDYILAGEIVQTTKMYARTVSPLRKDWIEHVDPDLLHELRLPQEKKKARLKQLSAKDEMEKYAVSDKRGKPIYLVPLMDIKKLNVRSGAVKFYLKCAECISKTQVKASRIDKEISLIPQVSKPSRTKIKGKFDPARREFGEIEALLDCAFMPFATGKKEFSFLAVVDRGGKYSLAPMPSIGASAKETLFSLSSMIDRIPRKQERLRKKILKLQQRITTALDMDD
ncbi:MAG: ATP-dependent RNA helicase [Spirochaetes bacterium]|uniref:ATP-dependent RNA helicase n=1 Tax=Candidatus Ornithospirochaeta stercoripullorum TaxID=2840899 RepID=A0A9D9H5K6_9SPIO|nr:ATP-dependent RNA helicase [Candidatus Ornithospirochaeta stercoripullorum]